MIPSTKKGYKGKKNIVFIARFQVVVSNVRKIRELTRSFLIIWNRRQELCDNEGLNSNKTEV